MNVQTNTPVRSVAEAPGGGWNLVTDRGTLKTEKVVYATNAFTATLLPEFLGRIAPYRGQCSAVVPTKPFSGPNILTHTYSHRYGLVSSLLTFTPRRLMFLQNNFDYMIQRPKDGIVIIGGGRWKVPVEELVGYMDDSEKLPVLTEHLKGAMKTYMTGWGEEAVGEGLLCDWTGESPPRRVLIVAKLSPQVSWGTLLKVINYLTLRECVV